MSNSFAHSSRLLIIFALSLSLLHLAASQTRPDEPTQPTANSAPAETPAERTIRILQVLNGKWEFTDASYRSFELEFNDSGYANGDKPQKEPTQGVTLEANTVATGHIEKIRPLDLDLFCTATKAAIVDKRLVLDSLIRNEDERYRFEIFDVDKIDAHTTEIRVRVVLPRNQTLVWFRSGTTLLFQRQKQSESSNTSANK